MIFNPTYMVPLDNTNPANSMYYNVDQNQTGIYEEDIEVIF